MGIVTANDEQIQQNTREVRRVTWWGLVANLLLSGIKFLLGFLGNCQALVADAVHSLSDTVTDFTVLFGSALWSKPPDEDHPHGHGRIETLVSLIIGVLLGIVGIGLGYRAIATIGGEHSGPPELIALIGALVSIGVKEWLYRWTARVGRRVRSSAVLANAWHHRSDALSSVPVAVAVTGAQIMPSLSYLDQIAAVVVSVMILKAAFDITWPALVQLIDAGANASQRRELLNISRETPGVLGVHGLRTRHIGPGLQVDMHIQVEPELTVREGHAISHRVKDRLIEGVDEVVDVLIHLEPLRPTDLNKQ